MNTSVLIENSKMQFYALAVSSSKFLQKMVLRLHREIVSSCGYVGNRLSCWYQLLVFRMKPFWIHLCYFILLSVACFLSLKAVGCKDPTYSPNGFDLLFMAVSSATIASNSTLEMEVFSDTQLLVITVFMLLAGQIFTSLIDLQLMKTRCRRRISTLTHHGAENMELGSMSRNSSEMAPKAAKHSGCSRSLAEAFRSEDSTNDDVHLIRYNCVRYLTLAVLGYFLVVQLTGILSILVYVNAVGSARQVLEKKGLNSQIFSVFMAVSSFANCGFVPTNENMVVFRRNSGLLSTIIIQVLLGNTLFGPCLRLLIWVLRRITGKAEFEYMLKKPEEIRYHHLLRPLHCRFLVPTVLGFLLVQLTLFCVMEWGSQGLSGMTSSQKLVGALFQSANTRHGGQWVVDLSTLAPATIVLFVVVMYLPPYTSYLPAAEDNSTDSTELGMVQRLILSPLAYLSICTVLICVTENKKIAEDPINFNVFNIIVEVIRQVIILIDKISVHMQMWVSQQAIVAKGN